MSKQYPLSQSHAPAMQAGEALRAQRLADAKASAIKTIANTLRAYWSFDSGQQHTHSWHSREDFIEIALPMLLEMYVGLTSEERK